MRVSISLTGEKKSNYQNSDDSLSMDMWKARVDRYGGVDFSAFIADGTIVAHYLVDEPKVARLWGGDPVSNADLEEMARYSKSIWPNLPTVIRDHPTRIYEPGFTWQYLDAAWGQYNPIWRGDVNAYIANEAASAKAQGLGLIAGLQALTGGDGSSGIRAPDGMSSKWTMSADELRRYGTTIINEPYVCAFNMWTARYDYGDYSGFSYFTRSNIEAVVADLSWQAAQRSAASCVR